MAKFSYKVRDREDRVLLGTMDAATADEVLERLTQKSFLPILVKELSGDEIRPSKSFREIFNESMKSTRGKVPFKSVVFFTRQLATMVGQGVPLSRSLDQLSKGEDPAFKKIILQVSEDIATGFTLSDALARHPGAFNQMFVAVVHSGEVAGALDKVLDGMANYLESMEIMRGKVKTAMRYPVFIGGFVGVMLFGIMWKLVPTFEGIYASMNAVLPAPTQMLILVSRIVRQNTMLCLIAGFSLFVAFKYMMTRDWFKIEFQRTLLRAPVFGGILQKNIWATYCRTMSLLMGAGTPILKATEIAGTAVNNRYFQKSLESIFSDLRKGDQLSEALESSKLFPVLVVQLVATGESSGRVDVLLGKAADFYERELRNVVDSLSSIIEPILIVTMGSVVGAILFSLYLPIFMIGKFIH
ncbi:MAG: type II secretion system F family protein [Fibrobacterota bacterium]|nr:type II secretion system F family protein [Fibrobacterota bacterium]